MEKLNRSDLIEQLAARCSITYSDSERFIHSLENLLFTTLKKGGIVNWHGLGRFSVGHMKDTLRRNPRTKEIMKVPAHHRPKFVFGEKLTNIIKDAST
jgi:DNA-binding protein HU-beta